MKDYFYKFIDQEEMFAELQPLGMTYTTEDGSQQVIEGTHQYAAWVVGIIEPYEGWHLNVRQIDLNFDLSSLDKNEVHPPDPICVWA